MGPENFESLMIAVVFPFLTHSHSGKEDVYCASDNGFGCREFVHKILLEVGRLPSLLKDVVQSMLYSKQKIEFSCEDL